MGIYDRASAWPRRTSDLAGLPPPVGVLLADPAEFAVLEIHNPHMADAEGRPRRVDAEAARAQWLALAAAYADLGLRVEILEPAPGLRDLCFTANPSLVLPLPGGGAEAWLGRMTHGSRRGETAIHRDWFAGRGYQVRELPRAVSRWEGGGDGVPHPGRHLLHAGVGPRSELAAWEALAAAHPGLDILLYALPDPHYYHLDTALAALDEAHCLYAPRAFDARGLELLHAAFAEPIAVSDAEALNFACNAHCPDGRTVLISAGNPRAETALRERGFTPVALDLREFHKSGGSAFCLKQALWAVAASA